MREHKQNRMYGDAHKSVTTFVKSGRIRRRIDKELYKVEFIISGESEYKFTSGKIKNLIPKLRIKTCKTATLSILSINIVCSQYQYCLQKYFKFL